jgi:hypothetical protein
MKDVLAHPGWKDPDVPGINAGRIIPSIGTRPNRTSERQRIRIGESTSAKRFGPRPDVGRGGELWAKDRAGTGYDLPLKAQLEVLAERGHKFHGRAFRIAEMLDSAERTEIRRLERRAIREMEEAGAWEVAQLIRDQADRH